jgi:hypothetical protein
MKNLVGGIIVLLFGADILQGNISHDSYDFMTVFAVVLVLGGLWGIFKGIQEKRAEADEDDAPPPPTV